MKYTKEQEKSIIPGVVYYLENDPDKYLFMMKKDDLNQCVSLNIRCDRIDSNSDFHVQSGDKNFRQADSTESAWAKYCFEELCYISREKFIKNSDYEIY